MSKRELYKIAKEIKQVKAELSVNSSSKEVANLHRSFQIYFNLILHALEDAGRALDKGDRDAATDSLDDVEFYCENLTNTNHVRNLRKYMKKVNSGKQAMVVKGYDRSFVKKVENLTNSKFVNAEDTGEGQLYYFDICDTCDLFEVEVSYESEDEYGEPQEDQTWFVGDKEFHSERDFLKFVGKIADEYRRYR